MGLVSPPRAHVECPYLPFQVNTNSQLSAGCQTILHHPQDPDRSTDPGPQASEPTLGYSQSISGSYRQRNCFLLGKGTEVSGSTALSFKHSEVHKGQTFSNAEAESRSSLMQAYLLGLKTQA